MSINVSLRTGMYMIVIIVIWGLTATIEAVSLTSLSPFRFTAWSTVFGAVGAATFTVLRGRAHDLVSFGFRDHARLFMLSLLGFGIYFSLKFTAYTISPIPQANILQYTFTVFIVLFAVPVMRQPLTAWKFTGVIVGFAGAGVVMTGGRMISVESAYVPGYLCALGAGVSFALFSVAAEKYRLHGIAALAYFHGYSAVLLFLVLAVKGEFAYPGTLHEIGGVFYSGFISNVIGMQLWLTVQSDADDVSVLTGFLYLVPFASLLSFRFFLCLTIPLSAYSGLVLIMGGMLIHRMRKNSVRIAS